MDSMVREKGGSLWKGQARLRVPGPSQEGDLAPNLLQKAQGGPMRCLILLADDFDDGRELCAFALRQEGFTVKDLSDGSTVMSVAIEVQPEVMVLDLTLPGVDGWTLIGQLKAHPVTRAVPIVVLSAHAYQADEDRAMAAGADVYLRKPCTPADLVGAIRSVSAPCAEFFRDPDPTPSRSAPRA
jgi:CheY-like chemotaxis protein